MGVAFCVVFERDVPPYGTLGGDNIAIGRVQRALDRIARQSGLPPLSDFESYDPESVADFMNEEEAAELQLPPARWFAADAGASVVRTLIAHLQTHANAVSSQDRVLDDLVNIEQELNAAVQTGVQFRFAQVP